MSTTGGGGISVILPTYNRAHALPDILAAILSDPAVSEVIVVSDASPDATVSAVRGISESDERLRLILMERNGGPQLARLAGVEAASQPLVLLLDDDVLVAAGCVSGHAAGHGRPHTVLVGHMPVPVKLRTADLLAERYAARYDEHVETYRRDSGAVLRGLWAGNVSLPAADYLVAARRTDPGLRQHEDQELGLLLLEMGCHGVFDDLLASEHHYTRTLAGTLRDARRSGAAYASLVKRHPSQLPPPGVTFAPELSNPWLRRAARLLGWRPAHAALQSIAAILLRSKMQSAAGPMVSLLSRSDYVRGYVEASGGLPAAALATRRRPAA